MELVNESYDFDTQLAGATPNAADIQIMRSALESLALLLAPFAPHAAEEMWEGLGHTGGILARPSWPDFDADLAKDDLREIPIQVNGKLRSRVNVLADTTEEGLRLAAFADEKVRSTIGEKEVIKIIVVPGKLVNIVVKG
jgi:leucyl-tRNA synthetase